MLSASCIEPSSKNRILRPLRWSCCSRWGRSGHRCCLLGEWREHRHLCQSPSDCWFVLDCWLPRWVWVEPTASLGKTILCMSAFGWSSCCSAASSTSLRIHGRSRCSSWGSSFGSSGCLGCRKGCCLTAGRMMRVSVRHQSQNLLLLVVLKA